jgi:elongation factor Ts
MASVDMNLLKQLREITFAPLKDCREALIESNGDLDQAQEILRKKGMWKAGSKSERETNEGLIKVIEKNGKVCALKLLCETDFVAKNEQFAELMENLLEKIANLSPVKNMEEVPQASLDEMNALVAEFVGKLWENTKIGDIVVSDKKAFLYNHPGNKVASIIYYEGDNSDIAKEVALQVAAMNPTYLSFESVPADYREKLMVEFKEEMKDSGKPENIVEQILEGKLKKALGEFVLLEQEYIRDGAKKIKDILPADFKVTDFVRLAIR